MTESLSRGVDSQLHSHHTASFECVTDLSDIALRTLKNYSLHISDIITSHVLSINDKVISQCGDAHNLLPTASKV